MTDREHDKVVAVVGYGYWGPNLVRNFQHLRGCQVKYVCDLDEGRLEQLKRLYPTIKATDRFDDILSDGEIDGIAVATPVHSHFPLARKSLMQGKHVLIEKPMAASSDQCKELIRLAAERHRTLMVGHTFLYAAAIRKIKEIIDSGELGELLYITSQRLNLGLFQKDINVAWDLAPHDLSIVLYVLNQLPQFVNAQGMSRIVPGIEEVMNIWLEFADGTVAMIHNSWLDPNKVRRMTFVGTKKMILYDDTEPLEKIKIYDKYVEVPPHYDTYAEFYYSYHYGDMYAPYLTHTEPLKMQCEHFLECMRTGMDPLTSGLDGLKVVKILEMANRSMRSDSIKMKIDWENIL